MSAAPAFDWQLRTRVLALGPRPLVAGILNVTPDSFSDGGRFLHPTAALDQALRLLDEGADLLDLGGESTRPGAEPIAPAKEQRRILPVLRAILAARPGAIVSVDTYRVSTAQRVLDLGAEIINDVSGLRWDEEMAALLARECPGCILMHTRGTPQTWAALPPLVDSEVVSTVLDGLRQTLVRARAAGIPESSIVLDPGFGFGKLGAANDVLLAGLAELHTLGRPLLVGVSRKRFLTAHLTSPTLAERDAATTDAHRLALAAGAHVLRVHNVPAARALVDSL